MANAKELLNDARDLLERAQNAKEDKEAFDRIWAEYEGKQKEADEALEDEGKLKAALEKYDAPPTRDHKDATVIPTQRPEDAKDGVMLVKDGGGYEVVAFASEESEGWIKGYPASVQHPSIVRRLPPDLKIAAQQEVEAFIKYCRFGLRAIEGNQYKALMRLKGTKALQEDVDAEGGFLAPADVVRQPTIILSGVPAGVMRPMATINTTTRLKGDWPTSTDDVSVAIIAEEAAGGEADPTLAQVTFTIRKVGRTNKVSEELLADSAADIPALLGQLFLRGYNRFFDGQAIGGDGTSEPEGLRTTAGGDSLGDYNAGTNPDFDDILKHYFDLPAQWRDNLTWFTTSSFLKHIVAINAATAGVRVVEFMGDPIRPVILGRPVVLFDGAVAGQLWDDAGTIAVNEEFGAVGDFRNYFFFDRVGITITRLEERFSDTDQIGFKARMRYDSRVAVSDAFRIMKAAAA